MHRSIAVAIAGLGVLAVSLVACTKYDYDPNQPRNWVQFYQSASGPVLIDTLSIATEEFGVRFDSMHRLPADEFGPSSSFINATSFNCKTSAITIVRSIDFDSSGKPVRQDNTPEDKQPGRMPDDMAIAYRQLCKQTGIEPGF